MIDIITLARQAGFITGTMHDAVSGECHTLVDSAGRGCLYELTRFAELVAAAEREECAQIADDTDHEVLGRGYYDQLGDARASMRNIAAAIRARRQK